MVRMLLSSPLKRKGVFQGHLPGALKTEGYLTIDSILSRLLPRRFYLQHQSCRIKI